MRRCLCLLTLLFAVQTSLSAQPLPIDADIHIGRLHNGITYYVRSLPSADQIASLRLVVPVGSVVEAEDERGVAHFVEHLLFHGTESFSKEQLETFLTSGGAQLGADFNAFTGFDETVYALDIPADAMRVERAIFLLSEWASRALLDDRAVEEERGIVLEEWRRGLGAETAILESAVAALADGTPYAERLPIGLEEIIRTVSGEKIRGFYERWYLSAPVAVVVVGNIDPQAVIQQITRTFGRLEPRGERAAPPCCSEPNGLGLRFVETRHPSVGNALVSFLFKGDPLKLTEVSDLKQTLITQLALQMLGEVLRHENPFSHISMFPFVCSQSVVVLETSCAPWEIEPSARRIARLLATVARHGFPEELFERAVKEVRSRLRLKLDGSIVQTPSGFAEACINHFLHEGTLCTPQTYAQLASELLSEISTEEVSARVAQWNPVEDCVLQLTLPPTHFFDTDQLLQLIVDEAYGDFSPLDSKLARGLIENIPSPGTITDEIYRPELMMTELVLSNGLKVCLRPVPENRGFIALCGIAFGGLSDVPEEHLIDGRIAGALLEHSGIGGIDPEELSAALAGKQASVSRYIGDYTRSLSGSALRGDEETLFQLLHQIFTAQTNQREVYENLMAALWGSLSEGERFVDVVRFIVTDDHPYFRRSTLEDLESACFEKANELALEAFSNPAEFTLFFAGDFDVESMKTLAKTYLASIPTSHPPRSGYKRLDIHFKEGVTEAVVYGGHEPQSVVQINFPLSLRQPTAEKLEVLAAACDIIHWRIFDLLREQLSATYAIDSGFHFLYPDTLFGGSFAVQFTCDPQDAHLLAGMALRELRLLRERGPLTDEVADRVDRLQHRLESDQTESRFWTWELSRYFLLSWPLEGLQRLTMRPRSLTKEAIHERLEQILNLDNYGVVILYPEPS